MIKIRKEHSNIHGDVEILLCQDFLSLNDLTGNVGPKFIKIAEAINIGGNYNYFYGESNFYLPENHKIIYTYEEDPEYRDPVIQIEGYDSPYHLKIVEIEGGNRL